MSDATLLDAGPVERRKRPVGVYIIVVLELLNGVLMALSASEVLSGMAQVLPPRDLGATVLGILFSAIATARWIVAIGLWKLQRWAWIGVMIFIGISLLLGIGQYLRGQPSYLTMIVNVIVVFYLNQRDVQDTFVRRTRREFADG